MTVRFGWGIYLGKSAAGVGVFLFGQGDPGHSRVPPDRLRDRREIRRADSRVQERLRTSREPNPFRREGSEKIQAQLEALDLPDLEAMRQEHREREAVRVAGELEASAGALHDAIIQREALIATRDSHPCHSCPVRKEHRDYLNRIDTLERERHALEEVLERENEAEDARIRGVIRGIREVLHRFGYLHRGYPTAKADMLADVFDNDGLILCELVDRGCARPAAAGGPGRGLLLVQLRPRFPLQNHFTLPDHLVLAPPPAGRPGARRPRRGARPRLFISEGHNATSTARPGPGAAARRWPRSAR